MYNYYCLKKIILAHNKRILEIDVTSENSANIALTINIFHNFSL
jgi:hypothetical protein